jgi:hypothetical protein
VTDTDFRLALASFDWTQRRFAEYVGVDERSVRRWAAGRQPIPRWVHVVVTLMRQSWPHLGV